jgi:hypothetical protein
VRFHFACVPVSKHLLLEARQSCQELSLQTPHRNDGKRFVVRADEKLTAFMELEAAICVCREA